MSMQVNVVGGNLFRLAAQYLGDARQWWRIAQASNLTDPQIYGLVTVTIPDSYPDVTDGIPPQ